MRTSAPLTAPLFRSEGQARLLAELLLTGEELSVAALAERAQLAYPTAHREVARLRDADLLRERRLGNIRLVSGNPDSPLLQPVRTILLVSTGPVVLLRQELGAIPGIGGSFLFGSFAARSQGVPGPPPQDIDVLVLGDPVAAQVYASCRRVSDQVGRVVNPTIMTPAEWAEETGFVAEVKTHPVVPVTGGDLSSWL